MHPRIAAIKHAIEKTYRKRGESVVQRNFEAVDAALAHLHEVQVPSTLTSTLEVRETVTAGAPEFVRDVTARMIAGHGDLLPVSALPVDGTYPGGTTRWERRNIAVEIPEWDPGVCIQCNKGVVVCPHAVIRPKICDPVDLSAAPEGFRHFSCTLEAVSGRCVHPPDCTRGLHRLRTVRRSLSRQEQV